MGEFLPPMPCSHSDNLSPFGTDFAKDMVHKISLSFMPRKSVLLALLSGRRKNRSLVDVQRSMYSVDEKFVDRLMMDGVCWHATEIGSEMGLF